MLKKDLLMRDIENTKQHFPIKDSLTEIWNFEIEFCIQRNVIYFFKSTMLMALT